MPWSQRKPVPVRLNNFGGTFELVNYVYVFILHTGVTYAIEYWGSNLFKKIFSPGEFSRSKPVCECLRASLFAQTKQKIASSTYITLANLITNSPQTCLLWPGHKITMASSLVCTCNIQVIYPQWQKDQINLMPRTLFVKMTGSVSDCWMPLWLQGQPEYCYILFVTVRRKWGKNSLHVASKLCDGQWYEV